MNAEEFNEKYPVGSPVEYWPAARHGAGRFSVTVTPAWTMPSGDDVVTVDGYSGGIALTHIKMGRALEQWRDIHGDIWVYGDDDLMYTKETRPFPREHVEHKWGPLVPV